MRNILCQTCTVIVAALAAANVNAYEFEVKTQTRNVLGTEELPAHRFHSNRVQSTGSNVLLGFSHSITSDITYLNRKDLDVAISNLTQVIETGSSDSMLYLRRGIYYLAQNELDRALDDFNDTILHNPENGFGYLGRGRLRYEHRRYDDAILDLTEALRLTPSEVLVRSKSAYVELYGTRGKAHLIRGNLDNSIAE